MTSIVLRKNGPIRIEGPVTITTETGEIIEKEAGVSLCRCGGSTRKPFCDGTHKANGFCGDNLHAVVDPPA